MGRAPDCLVVAGWDCRLSPVPCSSSGVWRSGSVSDSRSEGSEFESLSALLLQIARASRMLNL